MTRQKISLSSCSTSWVSPGLLSLSFQFKTAKNRNNYILPQHHGSSRWLPQRHLFWPGWEQLPKAREFGNDTHPCLNSSLSSNRQDRAGATTMAEQWETATLVHILMGILLRQKGFSASWEIHASKLGTGIRSWNTEDLKGYSGGLCSYIWQGLFQPLLGGSPAPATSEDHFHGSFPKELSPILLKLCHFSAGRELIISNFPSSKWRHSFSQLGKTLLSPCFRNQVAHNTVLYIASVIWCFLYLES